MSGFENISYEVEDGVGLVRFLRSGRLNALSPGLVRELARVLQDVSSDEEVRALVLTGDERAFSSGADLKEETPPLWIEEINSVFNRLERLRVPTIAAISGWCIAGGLELAMACDLRVAAPDAKIGDWHVKVNSIGGAGATVRLVRHVGLARAKELVFTGAAVDGHEALRIGLVNRVCGEGESILELALALAREIAAHNPVTVEHAKTSLEAAADLDLYRALEHSLVLQAEVERLLGGDVGAAVFAARGRDARTETHDGEEG